VSVETAVPVKQPAYSAVIEPKISHALILTSAQLARGLGRLLFVLVAARVLGPGQFGVYALLLAIAEMLAVASGSGYGDYLTREAAKDARVGWGLGGQLVWLRLACAFPLAGAALGTLWLFGRSSFVLTASAWLFLSLAPRSVSETVQGVLRGIGRYIPYLVVELVFDSALVGGAVFIVAGANTLSAVIAIEVIAATAAAVTSAIFVLMFRTKECLRLNRKQLFEKSAIFNIYALAGNLYDRLDIVLLSKLAGDYGTGVYSAAYRPLGAVQLVPYGVFYSLLPALSRNAGGVAERRRLETAMGFLLNVAFTVVLVTMVFAGPAVRHLLGQGYAESAVALKILIWAVIPRYVNYALNIWFLAAGRERVFVATSLVCFGINISGNLLLIPTYSWRGAAAVTIVTEFALLAQNLYWLRRAVRVIPKPAAWVRNSLVFVGLLSASLAGARVAPPLLIGSACVLLFIVYLYQTGMVGEFVAIWRVGRNSALEGF
jgi:O-antigen/teichoic acid export membrane protein